MLVKSAGAEPTYVESHLYSQYFLPILHVAATLAIGNSLTLAPEQFQYAPVIFLVCTTFI